MRSPFYTKYFIRTALYVILMSMDPNLVPPAPPPLPVQPPRNPYDFITQEPLPPKKQLIPGNGSKKQRLLIILGGATLLIMLVYLVLGLLGSADKGRRADYISLAQQQTEIIRICDIGINKSQSTQSKNLALNIKYSQVSEQPEILKLAKKSGAKLDPKTLSLGQNKNADDVLTTATQNNEFDTVFVKTITDMLKKYQQTLKKVHDNSSNSTTKALLEKDYNNASNLLGNQKQ